MRFWTKSLRIFNCPCANATQSVRRIAHQTGFSKSSVHRLRQAMERRNSHPESWFWETEEGRRWLTRLIVATLYTFGLKRGVGLDTMSEFFARLHLATQVGGSPSASRRVMQVLEMSLLETAETWEQDGYARGEVREIIGAVDETFLQRMILVFYGPLHGVSAAGRGGRRSYLCHLENTAGGAAQGARHWGTVPGQ